MTPTVCEISATTPRSDVSAVAQSGVPYSSLKLDRVTKRNLEFLERARRPATTLAALRLRASCSMRSLPA
jgi:hypothetical protein